MSIIHSDKRISASQIPCDGTLKVTISLTAKPDIQDHPADVVLVLDRSRSMAGRSSMKSLRYTVFLPAGSMDFRRRDFYCC